MSVTALIKLYLWLLKFECHINFMSPNIILLLIFPPQLFKNVEIILSLWAVQKQAVGQLWAHELWYADPFSKGQ